jgi:hypothetical protein
MRGTKSLRKYVLLWFESDSACCVLGCGDLITVKNGIGIGIGIGIGLGWLSSIDWGIMLFPWPIINTITRDSGTILALIMLIIMPFNLCNQ